MAKNYVNHTKIGIYEFFYSNKKRKTYTNLGVSLLLVIILLLFALRPTILTIKKIEDRISKYEKVNTKVAAKVRAAQALAQQRSFSSSDYDGGLKDEIDFLSIVFLADPNIKLVYNNLYERAKKNDVVIKSLTPKYNNIGSTVATSPDNFDQSKLSPSFKSYDISLSLEANDITKLQTFIGTLEGYESNPMFSRIKNVSISNLIEDNKIKASKGLTVTQNENVIFCSLTLLMYVDESRLVIPPVQ